MAEFVKCLKRAHVNYGIARNKYHNYGSFRELDKLVDSKKVSDRLFVVQLGYGLDKLVDDTSPKVQKSLLAKIA